MGSGTTRISALNLKRTFIGIPEIDKERFEIAQANIHNHKATTARETEYVAKSY